MFIPIILSLCKQLDQPSRYILIPLSYVCILGGMTTLIGSSTNLLVSGSVFSTIGKEIGFFDFTKQGMILALVGFLYAVFLLPVIIKLFSKKNKDSEDDLQNQRKKSHKNFSNKTYKDYQHENIFDENKKSVKLDENQAFPQFNLNVSNPISWKLMLLIMLMQLLTNIMLVVVLYLK